MAFAKSIKITLLAVAGFVAVAALTLLLRQSRSDAGGMSHATAYDFGEVVQGQPVEHEFAWRNTERTALAVDTVDRKSTRLNSSHGYISYAVFCLKKKKSTT